MLAGGMVGGVGDATTQLLTTGRIDRIDPAEVAFSAGIGAVFGGLYRNIPLKSGEPLYEGGQGGSAGNAATTFTKPDVIPNSFTAAPGENIVAAGTKAIEPTSKTFVQWFEPKTRAPAKSRGARETMIK